jgi:hypothetical protein
MNMRLSLPSARRHAVHRDERAEGVAVRVLVGDQDELVGAAQLCEHLFPRRHRSVA